MVPWDENHLELNKGDNSRMRRSSRIVLWGESRNLKREESDTFQAIDTWQASIYLATLSSS